MQFFILNHIPFQGARERCRDIDFSLYMLLVKQTQVECLQNQICVLNTFSSRFNNLTALWNEFMLWNLVAFKKFNRFMQGVLGHWFLGQYFHKYMRHSMSFSLFHVLRQVESSIELITDWAANPWRRTFFDKALFKQICRYYKVKFRSLKSPHKVNLQRPWSGLKIVLWWGLSDFLRYKAKLHSFSLCVQLNNTVSKKPSAPTPRINIEKCIGNLLPGHDNVEVCEPRTHFTMRTDFNSHSPGNSVHFRFAQSRSAG